MLVRRTPFAIAVLLLLGCGYSTRSLVPSHLRTVGITGVANSTTQPALADELADSLAAAFRSDQSLRLVPPADADLAISVTLASYSRSASAYSSEQAISAYEVVLSARVEAEDRVRSEEFYNGSSSARFTYEPDAVSEEGAASRAVGLLARDIVRIVVTAW